jgi:RHS repeat-associated protein
VIVEDLETIDLPPPEPLPIVGAESVDTDIEYYHLDALGSIRMVTNRAGAVVARYDYLPFGEEIQPSLGARNQVPGYGASAGTRRFTGKERDFESGLDYFGARYMSGAQGRFTSPDPENEGADPMDPQSWNGYPYALNNPSKYVDPDGRNPLIGLLIGAPVGAWGEAIRQIRSGEDMSLAKSTRRILAAAAGGAVAGTIGGFGLAVEAPVVLGAFGGALGNATEAIANGERPTPKGAAIGAAGGALGGAAGKPVGRVAAQVVEAASGTVRKLTVKMGMQGVQAITHPNPVRARTFDYLANRTAEKLVQITEHALATGHAGTQHVVEVVIDQVHKEREREHAARQAHEDQRKSSEW